MQFQNPYSYDGKHSIHTKPTYMIQLDGLRALAIVSVLVHHFLPNDFPLNGIFHVGPLGVRLFFVISGFLITGILFRCKDNLCSNSSGTLFTLKNFYARRFLRLFPIYYLVIAVTCFFAFNQIKPSLVWHLVYASNIYFSINNYDALTAHFWSLAVEEQFYLIWPFIILFTPQNHLLKVLLTLLALGPVSRLIFVALNLADGNREYIFTTTCFDSLSLGALLSFQQHYTLNSNRASKYFTHFCFFFGGALFLLFTIKSNTFDPVESTTLSVTFASMFFVGIVGYAAQGFIGIAGKFLEAKPIVLVGRISYGIYVYHLLIAYSLPKIFNWLGLVYPSSIWIIFFLKLLTTIVIAIFSWNYIEKPINSMKKYFEYEKPVNHA